jgi:hypothetical protein
MAEKKPFIAARLRNPAEEKAEAKQPVKKAGFDYIGNIGALLALGVAVWLFFVLLNDLEAYNAYFGIV